MKLITVLGSIIRGKVLATTLIGTALLGTTGVALAATPGGQDIVQHITGAHATATPADDADGHGKNGKTTPTANGEGQKGGSSSCPGQSEAQQLASKFSLSTDSESSSIKVICTLHDGTFQGTVDDKSVTINHVLGYGEIDQLLTYAQSLAQKNNDTLTDSNVLDYVAKALDSCGSTAVVACVNANLPANQSGDNNESNGSEHNTSDGKPTATPTPHADGKPTSTPTPHASK